MSAIQQSVQLFNTLIEYLAKRDLDNLSKAHLQQKYAIEDVELVILLGNSSLFVAERAALSYQAGLTKKILVCGGKGHSTPFLYENVKKHPLYSIIRTDDQSEAELFKRILTDFYKIPKDDLLIEKESTNCGANAQEAYQLLKGKGILPKNILLMQDPVLQRRSQASFEKVFQDEAVQFISYASFVPYLIPEGDKLAFKEKVAEEFCDLDRFISLVMGEIPRLQNDENGYGPKGKNFIIPVEIPETVLQAYRQLLPVYGNYVRS